MIIHPDIARLTEDAVALRAAIARCSAFLDEELAELNDEELASLVIELSERGHITLLERDGDFKIRVNEDVETARREYWERRQGEGSEI